MGVNNYGINKLTIGMNLLKYKLSYKTRDPISN